MQVTDLGFVSQGNISPNCYFIGSNQIIHPALVRIDIATIRFLLKMRH